MFPLVIIAESRLRGPGSPEEFGTNNLNALFTIFVTQAGAGNCFVSGQSSVASGGEALNLR